MRVVHHDVRARASASSSTLLASAWRALRRLPQTSTLFRLARAFANEETAPGTLVLLHHLSGPVVAANAEAVRG